MKLAETIDYWAKMQDPDSPAEQAAVALAREVQRLQREASRHIEALVHYDAWFGDECGCSYDPCPIAVWGSAPATPVAVPTHCQCPACIDGVIHHSDCTVHAEEPSACCSCGVLVCDKCGGPYDGGCLVCGNPNGESAPCKTIVMPEDMITKGAAVIVDFPGSWAHGHCGIVLGGDTDHEGNRGHLVQFAHGVSILASDELFVLPEVLVTMIRNGSILMEHDEGYHESSAWCEGSKQWIEQTKALAR